LLVPSLLLTPASEAALSGGLCKKFASSGG
jgi:hypothetical protein